MILARALAIGLLCLGLQSDRAVVAFSVRPQQTAKNNPKQAAQASLPRRSFLETSAAAVLVATIPLTGNAVVLINPEKVGTVKALTPEEAEQRFRDGRASVDYLLTNYNAVCEKGGDNVRRYLGTVGMASGLFGIQKAMKALADRADDIVEYTELSREIEQTIEQADGSAYMSIFVTTSTSYTPPEKYFKDAKIEIERCAKSMDELAAMIGITF